MFYAACSVSFRPAQGMQGQAGFCLRSPLSAFGHKSADRACHKGADTTAHCGGCHLSNFPTSHASIIPPRVMAEDDLPIVGIDVGATSRCERGLVSSI